MNGPDVIRPVEYREFSDKEFPVFLLGPISGAGGWQGGAVSGVLEAVAGAGLDPVFVNPVRAAQNGAALKILTPGYEDFFPRQRAWERHYLEVAARTGAILAWLAPRAQAIAPSADGTQSKSYASMSRQELGTAMVRYPDSVVLGISPDFPEGGLVEDDFRHYASKHFPVHRTLEAACAETARRVRDALRGKRA